MADEVKYEYQTVKTVRGLESRSIEKAAREGGWELVDQQTGTLQTTLNFRRVRPNTLANRIADWFKALPLAGRIGIGAVPILLCIVLIAIGAATESEDEPAAASPTPSASTSSTSDETTTEPSNEPSEKPTEASVPEILTAQNSPEFRALLHGNGDPIAFADKYEGQTIQYDAYVAAMGPGPDGDKDFAVLLPSGSHGPVSPDDKFGINSAKETGGPAFQIHDDYDLLPGLLKMGLNVRVTATVSEYNDFNELFTLDLSDGGSIVAR